MCGEKRTSPARNSAGQGSPPRMRGKARARSSGSPRPRITPAYAGKRARPKTPPLTPRDHPRMCGEKLHADVFCNNCEGSPPHVRGKAGACTHGQARHWDHPRVCGEKRFPLRLLHLRLGSPPRMRGKELHVGIGLCGIRITPAYAGKRSQRAAGQDA